MAKIARLSIEKESKINENLMLEDKDLIVDYVCDFLIFSSFRGLLLLIRWT